MPVPDTTKGECKRGLRARCLLSVLEHRHQNRSGRIEGLQILGSSECPKFRLTIQKEKITI